MNLKVLCVDDDENILAGFQRNLRKSFHIDVAVGGAKGLERIKSEGPYAVVVADMQMPEMNGIEFLRQVETLAPHTVRIMLTGNADQKTAVDAVNQGHVFRFLNKPCPPDSLAISLEAALGQYRLQAVERDLLENTLSGAIRALSEILAAIKPRVALGSVALKDSIRSICSTLSVDAAWEVEVASMLLHVGYVTLPPAVMLKLSAGMALSAQEQALVQAIPSVSAALVSKIPRLGNVAKIIACSQKDIEPRGATEGSDLPMGSRILRVLQALGRNGTQMRETLADLRKCPQSYDPRVLDAIEAAVSDPNVTLSRETGPEKALKIALPVDTSAQEPTAERRPKRDNDLVCILVVDDKSIIADQVRAGLTETPWKVNWVGSAAEAVEFTGRNTVDLLLVSISLLGDGMMGLIKGIRSSAQNRAAAVFGLCLKTGAPDKARAQEIGLSAIVTKPIDGPELRRKACQALNLDTTHRYFMHEQGTLVLTLPVGFNQSISDAIFLNLEKQLNDAVEAGIDKSILDLSMPKTIEPCLIELVMEFMLANKRLGLTTGVVASDLFKVQSENFEETKCLKLASTIDEAIASLREQKAAA